MTARVDADLLAALRAEARESDPPGRVTYRALRRLIADDDERTWAFFRLHAQGLVTATRGGWEIEP